MVSKEAFERYVRVQASGVTNMVSPIVQELAEITKEEHYDILKNYEAYEKEYDIHVEDY